jgi:hypothetical protein
VEEGKGMYLENLKRQESLGHVISS